MRGRDVPPSRHVVRAGPALLPGLLLGLMLGLLLGLGAGCAAPEPAPRAAVDDAAGPGAPSAVDVGFSQDMTVHHDQAIAMAGLALDRAGPDARALARSILVGQAQEVGTMRGWLQLWGEPLYSTAPMRWMGDEMGDEMGHGTAAGAADAAQSMPGMATTAQLERLYRLRGSRFDDLFYVLMTRHHRGGIAMAQAAAESADLAVVRETARAMGLAQLRDLQTMAALAGT